MYYPYEHSPTPVQSIQKNYPSVSTKLTTAYWSLDHTSRAPSPLLEESVSHMALKVNSHIEKLNNYLKYFKDLSFQLKNSLDSEINKLSIKKSEILASIEMDFQKRMSELKLKHNEKNAKLIKNIKEISNEINKSIQIAELIEDGNEIEDDTLEELLQFSLNKEGFNNEWLKIRTPDEPIPYKPERLIKESTSTKPDLISTLYTESTTMPQDHSKLRVYVPFGNPIYSFYYLIKTGKGFKVIDLISSLQAILGKEKRLWVNIKNSQSDNERLLKPYECIPDQVSDTWPRLYIKFD